MSPLLCTGYRDGRIVVECCFHSTNPREPALRKADRKCIWCNPKLLRKSTQKDHLSKLACHFLVNLYKLDLEVFEVAVSRLLSVPLGLLVVERAEKVLEPDAKDTGSPVFFDPYFPKLNGPILLMKDFVWRTLTAGLLQAVVHSYAMTPMKRHVGHSGTIFGTITLGPGKLVESDQEWTDSFPLHQINKRRRPYQQTYIHVIKDYENFHTSIKYRSKRGGGHITKYRPVDDQRLRRQAR